MDDAVDDAVDEGADGSAVDAVDGGAHVVEPGSGSDPEPKSEPDPEPEPESGPAPKPEREREPEPEPESGQGQGPELVELALVSVELSPEGLSPATGTVTLAAVGGGGHHLDIVMARTDAALVQEAMAGTDPARPRTHDLLLAVLASLSGAVTGVTLMERRAGGVYVANVGILRPNGSIVELDARPSDAINVALRSPGAALRAARSLVDIPAN